ncbi:MAG: hypothetical protein AB1599_11135 [Planctomycetota bacterium]
MVVTYDGSTGLPGLRIYIDGNQATTSDSSVGGGITNINSNSRPFLIGARENTGGIIN